VRRLLQPRRDDADDAGMPPLARRPDERAVQPARFGLRQRLLRYRLLDLAPLAVQPVERFGQLRGLRLVRGGEEPRAEVGAADAPAAPSRRRRG
jgi:hypothetical protein